MDERAGTVIAAALAVCVGACSYIGEPVQLTFCETDDDCKSGEFCNTFEGSVCQEKSDAAVPREALALVVSEDAAFEAEILGCEATPQASFTELLINRAEWVDELELRYVDWIEEANQLCPTSAGYEPHPSEQFPTVCEGEFPARFTVRQPSRLGRRPLSFSQVFMADAGEDMPSTTSATFAWPHYPSSAAELPEPQVSAEDLRPPEDLAGVIRSRIDRVLVRRKATPGVYDAEVIGRERCHRLIEGRVVRYQSTEAVEGVGVSLTIDEPVAAPSTVLLDTPAACVNDDGCPAGQACSAEFGTCGLDLDGSSASATVLSDATGAVEVPIYSYCEPSSSPPARRYRVVAGPDDPKLGLPKLRYDLEQALEPYLSTAIPPLSDPMPGVMCTVDWVSSREIRFDVVAAPKKILELQGPKRTWTCCDATCLPGEEDLGEASPPAAPDSCTNFGTMTFVSQVTPPDDETNWEAEGCLPLVEDINGNVGFFSTTITPGDPESMEPACTEGSCRVWLTQGAVGDERTYQVRVEPPVGSLFRSGVHTVTVDADTVNFEDVELEPRVVLQGQIGCADDVDNCDVARATVVAERLRESDEDPSEVLGPFFYSTLSLADGSYYLPVNPGVYVITARPALGQPGGPTRYRILDLRTNADGVTTSSDGLLRRVDAEALEIEAGRSVRVDLAGFSANTRVEPFDTGSWRAQTSPDWPTDDQGQPARDLNAASTCYGEVDRGCRIRQVSVPVRVLASGYAQFTTRARGGTDCVEP